MKTDFDLITDRDRINDLLGRLTYWRRRVKASRTGKVRVTLDADDVRLIEAAVAEGKDLGMVERDG